MSDEKKTSHLEETDSAIFARQNLKGTRELMPWVIEFRVVGTPHIIKAPIGDDPLLLGRADEDAGIVPHVDLNPYGGQHHGVSRRHATLTAKDNRVVLIDMGSANGSQVNGGQVIPNREYRVRSGDQITLGRLTLQLNFVVKPYTNEETVAGMRNDFAVDRIGNGQTVLVIDEDVDVCRVIAGVLEQAGFQPLVCHSGVDAISMVDNARPQAVVMELMLPDINGLDVVKYIRGRFGEGVLPIMAISSATGGYRMGEAIEQGVDLFLAKPIALDELTGGLGKMVEMMA